MPIEVPGSGPGAIFQTDFTGDGTTQDPLPGTLNGAFGSQVNGSTINQLLTQYNNNYGNQATPAGQVLIQNGLFTLAQLQQLGAVAPCVAGGSINSPNCTLQFAPPSQVSMGNLRDFDLKLAWTYKIEAYSHTIAFQPSVGFFNLFNLANFDLPPNALTGGLTGTAGFDQWHDARHPNHQSRRSRHRRLQPGRAPRHGVWLEHQLLSSGFGACDIILATVQPPRRCGMVPWNLQSQLAGSRVIRNRLSMPCVEIACRALGALLLIVSLCPRAPALDPSLDLTQYTHTAWTARRRVEGSTRSIVQTPDGYLWIGTEFGLVRFDGVRFVPWSPPAGQQLPSSNIVALLAARDGTLWIGSLEGLASWKDGRLTLYPEVNGGVDCPSGGPPGNGVGWILWQGLLYPRCEN